MTTEVANPMNRNPKGKGGFGERPHDINAGGRPKGSLKSYVARKFAEMTDEEKEEWLKEHKVAGEVQWKMGEGNPQNDITSGGETLQPLLVKIIDDKGDVNTKGV